MSTDHKIAFLGTGKLGQALLRGLLKAKTSFALAGSVRTEESKRKIERAFPGFEVTLDNKALLAEARYIILGVKPQHALELVGTLRDSIPEGSTLISLCARLPIARLREALGSRDVSVVRLMPNTATENGSGLMGVSVEDSQPLPSELGPLFAALGEFHVIDEHEMDAFTILAACTPAFFLRMAEALQESALKEGFSESFTRKALGQVLVGAGELLLNSETSISERVAQIATPGGVTAQGLAQLDEFKLQEASFSAFKSALEKCQSLKL